MTDEEQLKILERAQFFYEWGLPGLCVSFVALMFGAVSHDFHALLIGGGMGMVSILMLQLGRHYKDKGLP